MKAVTGTLLFGLTIALPRVGFSEDISKIPELKDPQAFIDRPYIDYPYEAKRGHITGSGVVVLEINPATGAVTAVRMGKSTGRKILDAEVIRAFRNARFKKGTPPRVKIPVTFTLSPPKTGQ